MDILLLVGIVVFATTSFALQKLPIDVTALTTLGLLLLFNLVTPSEAIAGFSNPAVITVMMMFVLSDSLVRSGLVNRIGHRITHLSANSPWRASLLLLLVSGSLSAFINNTAAVAILMPVGILLAKHFKFSPSKILIPLSYVSILGGTCTLIGTSTNLLVSAMAADAGLEPFGVFEFAWVGLIFFSIGTVYLLLGPLRLLPSRSILSSLTRKYHMSAYLTEVRVPKESPLIGKTVAEEAISDRFELNVLEILRGKTKIAMDLRNTRIQPGDILIVRGAMTEILAIKEHYGLLLLSDIKLGDQDLSDESNILVEIQLSPTSQLVDQTLKDIDFRKRYGCFVLALNRTGEMIHRKLAFIPLAHWDTLLVFGPRARIEALNRLEDFTPLQEVDMRLSLSRRWWISAAIIPIVVLLAASGVMPILKASILGVVAMLLTRTVKIQQAYKSINWTVIFLLAAVLPIGKAMVNTGLDRVIGESIAALGAPYGPVVVLGVMLVSTSLLSEIISNNSAAVLMVPIAMSVAVALNVDPKPFLMGITFAASMSFMTPIGYQTNTMVYGPGGYRFTDFTRAGAPLSIFCWVTGTLLIPKIWPF
ncbi:MAG: SLC13 family permease [Acidobacteriota bacterium]